MKMHATASIAAIVTALAAWTAQASATSPGREGRIAFVVHDQRHDEGRLVTSRPDGSDLKTLADRAGAPGWSADGSLIAYRTITPQGLFVARADGSEARNVAGESGPLALSPNARTIVVARLVGADEDRSYLFAIDVATGAQTLVARDGGSPVFAPHGRSIAFVDFRQGHPGISTVSLDGRHRTRVFRGGLVESLDWSPDGRSIAFIQFHRRNHRAYSDLRVVNLRTGRARRLVRRIAQGPGAAQLSATAWSPTGRRLLLAGWNRDRSVSKLFVVGARTGRVVPLGVTGETPAWQPLP